MSENEYVSHTEVISGDLPAEIEQALRRYVEIQVESVALQDEKYRLRELISTYMEGKDASSISPEVDGQRLFVRNTTRTVVNYDEALLKERLGDDYKLILWPDPTKIKKNLPLVAPLLMPIVEEIGSPSQETVKAAIASGKVPKEVFDGAFEKRRSQSFSVSRDRGKSVAEDDGEAYDEGESLA